MAAKSEAQNLVEIVTPMPTSNWSGKAEKALATARAFVIATADDYVTAANALATIKGEWNSADKDREDLKADSLSACRKVDAYFRPALTFLKEAETLIKGKINAYDTAQEKIRKAAQDRADAEAREQREATEAAAREVARKTAEKVAAERQEAEDKRKAAEKAQRDADEAKARGDAAAAAEAQRVAQAASAAAAKLDAKAERTEERGADKAAVLQMTAAAIVAPVIVRDIPVVPGLARREEWLFEVVDESLIPREYLTRNDPMIARVVKAMKAHTKIPGIRAYPKANLASGAK